MPLTANLFFSDLPNLNSARSQPARAHRERQLDYISRQPLQQGGGGACAGARAGPHAQAHRESPLSWVSLLGARRQRARPGEHRGGAGRLFEIVCGERLGGRASKQAPPLAPGAVAWSLVSAGAARPRPLPLPPADPAVLRGTPERPGVRAGACARARVPWPGRLRRNRVSGPAVLAAARAAGSGGGERWCDRPRERRLKRGGAAAAAAGLEAAPGTAGRRGSGAERRRAPSLRGGLGRAGGGRGWAARAPRLRRERACGGWRACKNPDRGGEGPSREFAGYSRSRSRWPGGRRRGWRRATAVYRCHNNMGLKRLTGVVIIGMTTLHRACVSGDVRETVKY